MRSFLPAILLIAQALVPGPAIALEGRFVLEGMELVLKLGDGRMLRREALVGLSLTLSGPDGETQLRVDGFEEDPAMPGDPLPLYRMSLQDPKTQERRNLCEADPDGRRAAFAIPDRKGDFKLTCTSGAEGKCVLFGYHPWEERAGVPMRDLHRACMNMLRADYGGDDHPTTRNGTRINLYDRFGIVKVDPAPGMRFEAAWGPDGAVCVAHPRIADNITLEDIAMRYPGLKGRLGPHVCYEDAMRADPRALIFNQSTVTWRSPK